MNLHVYMGYLSTLIDITYTMFVQLKIISFIDFLLYFDFHVHDYNILFDRVHAVLSIYIHTWDLASYALIVCSKCNLARRYQFSYRCAYTLPYFVLCKIVF